MMYLPSSVLFSTYSTLLCAYRVLVGKHEGKISLGRPKHRWENNIKMVFKKWDGQCCTGLIWMRIGNGVGLL